MSDGDRTKAAIARVRTGALYLGVGGLLVGVLAAILTPARLYPAYLVGYLFWVGIPLGSCVTLMLHGLVGGSWGLAIREVLRCGIATLPLFALLLIPILIGIRYIYLWARPEAMAADELLQHKSAFLNPAAFAIRAIIYFTIWLGFSRLLLLSTRADPDQSSAPPRRRLSTISGPGLVVFGLTITFAAIDWSMSLEPHWFSSLYGLAYIVGQVLLSLAVVTAIAAWLSERPIWRDRITPQNLHDLGNLILAFVILWGYVTFSQYLIIWSANLPEEIGWYVARSQGGWRFIAAFLIIGHLFLPLLLLLPRSSKRSGTRLCAICVLIICMRLIDVYWQVLPAHRGEAGLLHWLNLAIPIAMGGLWTAAFTTKLKSALDASEAATATVAAHAERGK